MKKKLISWLLSSAMAVNILALMPINSFAASGDSRIYEKEGYTVTYSVGSEWDNSQTIEIKIENTGEESILNWALKYNIDGTLSNVWNSKMLSSNEEYTVIKNNGYNYEIAPGQSVNYGYILTSETESPAGLPENIEMYSRRIDVKSGYDVDFNVTSDWYTGFQAEIAITNTSAEPIEAWTLGFDSNFNINNIWNAKLLSGEEQSYVIANQLWTTPINPGESASFGFTADKSATENANADNFKLTAVVIGESTFEKEPVIDYEVDTDSDGLPDYYEEIIGSDPNTEHSDDDQLPDGYEALYLGTDPSKSDSDDNGISDADEDFDTDGLTNLEEYNLGTDPFLEDSDYDTISDNDEVNIYGTNPTKSDTDDDLVPDGDEVKLGLNPNNGLTNGTPDSERTFPQVVTAESEVLAAVNDDAETPFDVSLEITAAGVAESNVYARESGYSNAIENPSIIGIAPEFVYTDGLEVEEVTVKFELDDPIVDNTLGTYVSSSTEFEGIKRLNVFMFFDDVNMLLPVETFHDEATNTVYTTTDRMGTYCLVDMELFFDNLDIAPSDGGIEEEYEDETQNVLDEPVFSSYNISELKINTGYTEYKDNFDVAFVIDEVSYNESQLEAIKKEIQEVSEIIFKYSDNVTISVYGLNGYGQTHSSWYGRIDNSENINALLNKVTNKEITTVDGYVHISECIDYITAAHKSSESLAEREEYCFVFFNPLHTNSKFTQVNDNKDNEEIDSVFQFLGLSSRTDEYGMAILDRINREGTDINFSTITNSFAAVESGKYSKAMSEMTGGKNIDAVSYESVVTECIEHIYGEIPENVNAYKAIIATGYSTVVLDKPIIPKYAENAKWMFPTLDENNNLVESDHVFTEEEIEDCADTDDDGLWDFQEIMFWVNGMQVITFDDEGNAKLPTVDDVLNGGKALDEIYWEKFPMPTYVESGAKKAEEQYGDCWNDFLQLSILPINSDPTHEDGDGDGKFDPNDGNPLSEMIILSQMVYNDNGVNDKNKDDIESLILDADSKINFEYEQKMVIDFSWFYNDPNEYNNELALSSIIMSGLAYHTTAVEDGAVSDRVSDYKSEYCYAIKDKDYVYANPKILTDVMADYGFENCETINLRNCKDDNDNYYNDNHYIQFDIGHKDISDYAPANGTNKTNLLAIFVRGTHGTEEWYSNFDIGNTDEWTEGTDWKTKANHMGFDVAAYRAYKEIIDYIPKNMNPDNTVIWLTGHSRGAAVSGIIATYLIEAGYTVYGYNFATPNQVETTLSENNISSYNSIFNIINNDDLVPYLPLSEVKDDDGNNIGGWGFDKYGITIPKTFDDMCVLKWDQKDVDWFYQKSNKELSKALSAFLNISASRNECYSMVYNENGELSDDYVVYYMDYRFLQNFYNKLPPEWEEKEYYKIYELSNGMYAVYQKPIYFMQILAGVAAGEQGYNSVKFMFGNYAGETYFGGSWHFSLFALFSDYMNPHFVDSYIILCERYEQ